MERETGSVMAMSHCVPNHVAKMSTRHRDSSHGENLLSAVKGIRGALLTCAFR
jgi:hypothetical protein